MGYRTQASEDEALVNSGSIHGKNLGFVADQRLTADARPADPTALLGTVNELKVFTHAPSANYCAHRNWSRADCAGARTTGLLAQQVATVLPAAVSTPSTLTLTKLVSRKPRTSANATARVRGGGSPAAQRGGAGDSRAEVTERIQGVQSLDVHVLIAQLVGAVQAQSQQIAEQSKQNEEQSQQIAEQSRHAMQQDKQIEEQSTQIAEQSRHTLQQDTQIKEQSQRITQQAARLLLA